MRVPVLLVLLALAGTARADDREDARHEFTAGQAADKQKDYQTALEHYLRANDLVPHPFAMFNIAADYEKLNKLREAAKWYERYLEAATDSTDRDKVSHTLAELRTRPSSLSVRSIPDGAQVMLDGNPVGRTPYSATIKGGVHHIVVEHDGQTDQRDLELEYAEPADINFTLGNGASGTLYVYGTPAGAYVAVDNVTVGVLPASVVLPPGNHAVRVTAYGYTTFETEAVVQPSQVTQTSVTLPRQLGAIDVAAGPKLQIGYLVGVSGGADIAGSGSLVLAEFGARASRFEGAIRVGRVSGTTGVDFIFRWAALDAVVSPVIGVGYAYANSAFGYAANGGLRWDVSRGERLGFSLIADFGLRWYSGTNATGGSSSGVVYPLELTAEFIYR